MQSLLVLKGPRSELSRVLSHVEANSLRTLISEPWWAAGPFRKWFWRSLWAAGDMRAESIEWHSFDMPLLSIQVEYPDDIPTQWLYRLAMEWPYLGVSWVFNGSVPGMSGVCRIRSVVRGSSRRLRTDLLQEPFEDAGVFSRVIKNIGEEKPYGID